MADVSSVTALYICVPFQTWADKLNMEAEKYQYVIILERDYKRAGMAVAELTIDQALQQGIEAHKAGQVKEESKGRLLGGG